MLNQHLTLTAVVERPDGIGDHAQIIMWDFVGAIVNITKSFPRIKVGHSSVDFSDPARLILSAKVWLVPLGNLLTFPGVVRDPPEKVRADELRELTTIGETLQAEMPGIYVGFQATPTAA